jgi:hypothetical protein
VVRPRLTKVAPAAFATLAALVALVAFATFAALAAGCLSQPRREPLPPIGEPMPLPPDAGVLPPVVVEPPEDNGLYSAEQAVADALSGPLTFIGTGSWYGIARTHACAYRNERVLVVNVYCTSKDLKAFRVDVFSPRRGRVRIYAEARSPISALRRDRYFTFKAETEPAPGRDAGLSPLTLAMSFAELQAYEKARYERFLPSCYGGVELDKPQGGCLGELAPRAAEWAERNDGFLARPPDDWYRLMQDLRARAAQDHK